MYAMGWGVPKDWVLAYALLYLAAEKGDTHATLIRGRIVTEMTPEQIREGKAIASQWKVGQTFPTESKTGRMNPPPITPEP
jgi:TPR repeat protein